MATYTKGSSTDEWIFPGSLNVTGTFTATGTETATLGADEEALHIDAGTTDHTGAQLIDVNLDVNSASVKVVNADISVDTALTGTEQVYGIFVTQDGLGGDAVGTGMTSFYATSANSTGGVNTGLIFDGEFDTGINLKEAGTTGILVSGTPLTALSVTGATTTGISITGIPVTGITVGTSGTPLALAAYTSSAMKVYTTYDSADAANSVEPVRINTVMTGVGGVGGRFRVNLETNVALGGWANAFKASVDCKTNGRATGLLSVSCHELVMPASAGGAGTYAILETEAVCPASWTGTNNVSILYFNVSGSTKANFDTYGYLLDINGVTTGENKVFYVGASAAVAASLRILVNGTPYYIMLASDQTA